MSKKFFIILILVIVLALGIALSTYFLLRPTIDRPYVAVYLETGDIYFGRLSYFPRLALNDVYIIQNIQTQNNPLGGPSLQLVPLKTSVWGGERVLLNPTKIVFIGKVGKDSQVMKIIRQGQ